MTLLVTGGAGFIGSNFILQWLARSTEPIVNLDDLTYAGNMGTLKTLRNDTRHIFMRGNITNYATVEAIFERYAPRAVINFAAESHVDRSIAAPSDFVQTNVVGVFTLLEASLAYWRQQATVQQENFRFLHISTDEVYGSLEPDAEPFAESHRYTPSSPYAATKAASDHLVHAWHHTYGLPTLITNCSNNYGPFQFPEKLIPLMVMNALGDQSLPVYGDGRQVRDWLYVKDHCEAIARVLEAGTPGHTYNIGGRSEKSNLEVVHTICQLLNQLRPRADGRSYAGQIAFVTDRAGHDRRYAINADKLERELGWQAEETFASGLRKTVQWYLDNQAWVAAVANGSHHEPAQRQQETAA